MENSERLEETHGATSAAQAQDAQSLQAEIFARRAARYAARKALGAAPRNELVLLRFTLGAEHYALELHEIARVLPLVAVTRVPGAPPELLGAVNLAGEMAPLIDLARVLGLPHTDSAGGYMLVIRHNTGEVALKVQSVESTFRVQPEQLLPVHETLAQNRCVKKITADGCMILALAVVLAHAVFAVQ